MIKLSDSPSLESLKAPLQQLFELAGQKVALIDKEYDNGNGSPVYTVEGKYTTRGWTEWTEGFRYGLGILHFDATGDEASLASGRSKTVARMASHVSHIGVHDHGFNNLSTYGNLRRLALEGRIEAADTVLARLAEKDILGGLSLAKDYSMKNAILVNSTEVHTEGDLDLFAQALKEVLA